MTQVGTSPTYRSLPIAMVVPETKEKKSWAVLFYLAAFKIIIGIG